jgi:hypothetical protein
LVQDRKDECTDAYLAALEKARATTQKRKKNREDQENAVRVQTAVEAMNVLISDLPEEQEEGSNVLPGVVALGRSGDGDGGEEMCEDSALERTREEIIQVSVPEYWEVVEKSTMATMNLFLWLYLPKCGVLQKNKPISQVDDSARKSYPNRGSNKDLIRQQG